MGHRDLWSTITVARTMHCRLDPWQRCHGGSQVGRALQPAGFGAAFSRLLGFCRSCTEIMAPISYIVDDTDGTMSFWL
jgi:hypothetical protein